MALVLAVAHLASVSVHGWMREWEDRRHVSDAKLWDTANLRLTLARRLNPLNADYSADLGRLMEWQSWRFSPQSADSLKYRALADRYYQETIEKRPSWGFAWAHYAENRLLSGKRDSEFLEALKKAMLLAPWEPGVQRKVAWMGMVTWDELPVGMRGMVEESMRRTVVLEEDVEELVRLAVQYGWVEQLKSVIRTDRQSVILQRILDQLGQG